MRKQEAAIHTDSPLFHLGNFKYSWLMRLHRFYVPEPIEDIRLTIKDPRLLHQWKNVFRMKKGNSIILFDGRGDDFTCRIEELSAREATCAVSEKKKGLVPTRNIWLFVSLIKKDKLEWVLEKATELGVTHIVTVLSERSEKKGFNLERAKKIIIEAAEQSGRSFLPALRGTFTLSEAIENHKSNALFALDPSGRTFESMWDKKKPAGFFIGPEGGWSEGDLALFRKEKVPLISLGELTLRSETAAIAASALALS